VVFFLYRWHNDALRNEYGSMFLHRLIPAESREEAWFLLNYVWEHWRMAYFSSLHYCAIAALVVAIVVAFVTKKLNRSTRALLISFTSIYLLGCLLFAVAMLKQFQDHDYYFLDTFYLPCVLVVVALLSFVPKAIQPMHRALYLLALVAFAGFAFRMPLKSQRNRHEAGVNNRLQNTIENFTGSAEYLDALGVPRNATMLVVDAVAPNVPLTLMDRKGLVVMWSVKGMIEHAFKWDFDYIVFQNEYFQDQVYRGYPDILGRIRKLGSNGRITVCTRDEGNVQTQDDFLGMTGTPLLNEFMDFEAGDGGKWKGYRTTLSEYHSGSRSALFSADHTSGLSMEWMNLEQLSGGYHPARLSLWLKSREIEEVNVVVWMSVEGREVFHEVRSMKDMLDPLTHWQPISFSFVLPDAGYKDCKLSVYLVSGPNTEVFYDDVQWNIYSSFRKNE
ncbi:MAG: hypothetical protein ACKO7B_04585, partial [Flavobacteriales bacterium]